MNRDKFPIVIAAGPDKGLAASLLAQLSEKGYKVFYVSDESEMDTNYIEKLCIEMETKNNFDLPPRICSFTVENDDEFSWFKRHLPLNDHTHLIGILDQNLSHDTNEQEEKSFFDYIPPNRKIFIIDGLSANSDILAKSLADIEVPVIHDFDIISKLKFEERFEKQERAWYDMHNANKSKKYKNGKFNRQQFKAKKAFRGR